MRNFFNSVSKFFKTDLNKVGDDYLTPLQRAIIKKDLKDALTLIEKGADCNLRGKSLHPPLHFALVQGQEQIALALLQKGVDVNVTDAMGKTPLHYAVMQGQEMIVLMLLKLNADPNAPDNRGRTPLHLLSRYNPQLIDVLVKYKAKVNAQDKDGNTPLHLFLDEPPIVARFLMNGADPNICNDRGQSPYTQVLDDGLLRRYPEILAQMIAYKADLGSVNPLGETILHLAARLELGETFRSAMAHVALSAKDAHGNNVLHVLVRTQNISMITSLLERAPELIHETNNKGATPLSEFLNHLNTAPDKHSLEIIRLLLDKKASPDDTDEKGRGMLHLAVLHDKLPFLDDLLQRGASPDLADRDKKTALNYAIERRNLHAMDMLLDHGADPDRTDHRGWTILDHLAERGDRDSPMVQRLIVAGATYHKQLPLHPEVMDRPKILDKGRKHPDKKSSGGHIDGPRP